MASRGRWTTVGPVGAILLAGCLGGGTAGTSVAPPLAQALAKASQDDLFIADVDSNVLIYTADINQSNPPLLGEITQGVSRSTGVSVDGQGTLYVLNFGGSSTNVTEYKRASTAPFLTITKGLEYRYPASLVVDGSGNLYVDENSSGGARVVVYTKGATSPTRTISVPTTGRFAVAGMALDPKGDLLVDTFDDESNTAIVYSIARHSSQAENLNLQGPPGPSLGADKAGYIYVGDNAGYIAIYPPGGTSPSRSINLNGEGFYSQMAVTPNGTIY
jgi:hypothetical protein